MILQGGGALGAYEVGAYKALCERLSAKDKEKDARKNRPLFDIIAGTSIGALNAALIVNSIKQSMKAKSPEVPINEMWSKSVADLERFWDAITFSIPPFENQFFDTWWNFLHVATSNIQHWTKSYLDNLGNSKSAPLSPENNTFNPYYLYLRDDMVTPAADAETARRFFSWLYFPYLLPNKVVTPNFPQPDTKFFTGVPRLARFDNSTLAKVAKDQNFWNYENDPIKTEFQKGEPRLLIVAVDIQDATSSVTLCESKYKDGTHSFPEHIIKYTDGISAHVRASMSPHTVINYPCLLDEQDDSNKDKRRYFWDGAYLSNTPLREVLHLHRYYWYTLQNARLNNTDEMKNKSSKAVDGTGSIDSDSNELHVPHLEIYIASLYLIVEQDQDIPPKDPDIIQDRELDIRFHDKTRYDKKKYQS